MTIVLAGGSGFLGRALHLHLTAAGHTVRILTRRPRPGAPDDVAWQPDGTAGPWAHALADADVIVNLAGEGIADKRWTPARKQALADSRILPARSLARAIDTLPTRPRTLITSSAVGYYGAHGDDIVTEQTPPGDDFLADLCVTWEREASAPASAATHVALVRTGIVLHPDGGALASMLTPFRLGLGGPMGSGRQYMSWIHLEDWLRLVAWLCDDGPSKATAAARVPTLASPAVTVWNACAPEPVTNADFGRTLGRVLRRPAVLPAPGFALRLLLGEFATFLLTGARVVPAAAQDAGFAFAFSRLEPALRDLLDR